jgi:hypothetical protein
MACQDAEIVQRPPFVILNLRDLMCISDAPVDGTGTSMTSKYAFLVLPFITVIRESK